MAEKLLNICFVAPFPPKSISKGHSCGGIAHWTKMVCDYAENRNDLKITVIDTMPRWRSVHNFSMWKRAVSGGVEFILYTMRLMFLLLSQRIDVIHLTTSGQLGIVRDIGIMFIAGLFKKPVIYHIRFGRISQIAESNSREWKMMALAIKKAHTVIAIDKATRDTIGKYLLNTNIYLIPNCINLSNLSLERDTKQLNRKIVLFAGWVIPTKGIVELLEAWSLTKKDGWLLQIAGPSEEVYQQQLMNNYQTKDIEFLGEKTHGEVLDLMTECDIFVLPSYTEGFPNVVLESMAIGRSIIATDVGAIPEMLENECGVLIKPKNVKSLVSAFDKLISDSKLREKLGKNASKKAFEQYAIDVVFAKYMVLWDKAKKSEFINNK